MGNKKYRYLFPIVHIIASFFYERLILDFSLDYSVVLSIPMGGVSDRFEMLLTYGISKLIACIFIVYLWKLIFFLIDDGLKTGYVRGFFVLFIVGLVACVFCFPGGLSDTPDNLITYSYACKLAPEYWHSMYSSVMYIACMMVAPFSISISIIQWLGFVCSLGYLFFRLKNNEAVTKGRRWLIFLLFLIPDTYLVVSDGYRTEQYAVLCVFYMSLVAMDIVEKKKRPAHELICLAVLSGFIGVWRSEGAILGVLGFIALIIFVYKLPFKKAAFYIALVITCYLIIGIPQKLGNTKYYGKDYSFINSFPTLHNIVNCETANLSYEGADEDLKAIEAVVPIDVVAYMGMDGYRNYNYAMGRKDVNQSMATKEAAEAYTKAFYRMVLHNLKIYGKNQFYFMMQALKLIDYPYVEKCRIQLIHDYPLYDVVSWAKGEEMLMSRAGKWEEWPLRQTVSNFLKEIRDGYGNLWDRLFISTAFFIASALFEIYIFFKELIGYFKKKNDTLGFAALAFVLLGQAFAITLVMPAGVIAYFHGFYYSTFVLELVYIINKKRIEK